MYIRKLRIVDFIAYLYILISSCIIVVTAYSDEQNTLVYLSFAFIGMISFYNAINTRNAVTIARIVNIFSFIFFFLAGWCQYSAGVTLWKGNGLSITYTDALYLKCNGLIIVSLLIFNVSYWLSERKQEKHFYREAYNDKAQTSFKVQDLLIDKSGLLSRQSREIMICLCLLSMVLLTVSGNLSGYGWTIGNSSINSQIWNMLRFVPVCGLVVYSIILSDIRSMIRNHEFLIMIVAFGLVFFPFWGNMARFLLFGAYMVLIALWWHDAKNKSLYFLLYYVGFVYFFSVMRHANSITALISAEIDFNHADFDAHQMLMALIQYTDEVGVAFGKNVLSAVFFLLPRSVWTGKLESTGGLVASYFGSWFTNVSSPLFGELYFAFGWLGVILGNMLLAKLVHQIDSWHNSLSLMRRGTFCIITGMTVYILRGSLLASMAFTLGLILAVWIISRIVRVSSLSINSNVPG